MLWLWFSRCQDDDAAALTSESFSCAPYTVFSEPGFLPSPEEWVWAFSPKALPWLGSMCLKGNHWPVANVLQLNSPGSQPAPAWQEANLLFFKGQPFFLVQLPQVYLRGAFDHTLKDTPLLTTSRSLSFYDPLWTILHGKKRIYVF